VTLRIANVVSDEDVSVVRTMLREYHAQLGVNLDFQGFEAELAALPGAYTPPRGGLLLAESDGVAVGCIAMRETPDGRAEMKRLYVRDAARGLGAGRALVERIISDARDAGYREMVLDTLPMMVSAQRMYERLGFRDIPAYTGNPVPGARFMGVALRGEAG
jgi:putative acetyltransferase